MQFFLRRLVSVLVLVKSILCFVLAFYRIFLCSSVMFAEMYVILLN